MNKWERERCGLSSRRMLIHSRHTKRKLPSFQLYHFIFLFSIPSFSTAQKQKTQSQLALKDSCIHIRSLINHTNTFEMHMSTQSDAPLTINLKPIHWLSCNSIHCADLYQCCSWVCGCKSFSPFFFLTLHCLYMFFIDIYDLLITLSKAINSLKGELKLSHLWLSVAIWKNWICLTRGQIKPKDKLIQH